MSKQYQINKSVFDLTFPELQEFIKSINEQVYRASQLWEWLYVKRASSLDDMTSLPKSLREKLKQNLQFSSLEPQIDLTSADGWTRKILFSLHDGSQVETVLMGYHKRRTACISTQAGCGLGCTFCATGQAGLQRNITAGEIVKQVLFVDRLVHTSGKKYSTPSPLGREGVGLTNLVYMGMGEPFTNYREVMKSIDILTDKSGYNLGARRITVSTVGLVPQIIKFADENRQVNLAVSLHAAEDDLRNTILPINKKYPLKDLFEACRYYVNKTNRRLSFEWALIDNVNDTPEQAKLLVKFLKGLLCHVNLIPLNPTQDYDGRESKITRIKKFRDILDKNGIPNTLRVRRGIDIHAGCGQLRQMVKL